MKVDTFNYLIMIHNSEYFCFFTDNDIQKCAAFYRGKFPEETFPPKFHTLQDHVVPFIKKWKFPLGFFGEQGGESIHHEFKLFEQTNISVKPALERLKKMLEPRHYVLVSPKGRELIPEKGICKGKRTRLFDSTSHNIRLTKCKYYFISQKNKL